MALAGCSLDINVHHNSTKEDGDPGICDSGPGIGLVGKVRKEKGERQRERQSGGRECGNK